MASTSVSQSVSDTTASSSSIDIHDVVDAAEPFSMCLLFRRYEASADIGGIVNTAAGVSTASITTAIHLPVPNLLAEILQINYQRQDTTMGKFIAELLSGSVDEMKGAFNGGDLSEALKAAKNAGIDGLANYMENMDTSGAAAFAGTIGNAALGGGGAQFGLDYLFNPNMSSVFQGVNPRSFTFQWKVHPTSAQEAQTYMDIINTIKARILPPEAGVFGPFKMIRYPDVLDTTILIGGKSAFPVQTSLVTDFSVDYGASGGSMSFFSDGKPSSISFSMTLTETHSLTRDRLQNELGGTFGGNTGL